MSETMDNIKRKIPIIVLDHLLKELQVWDRLKLDDLKLTNDPHLAEEYYNEFYHRFVVILPAIFSPAAYADYTDQISEELFKALSERHFMIYRVIFDSIRDIFHYVPGLKPEEIRNKSPDLQALIASHARKLAHATLSLVELSPIHLEAFTRQVIAQSVRLEGGTISYLTWLKPTLSTMVKHLFLHGDELGMYDASRKSLKTLSLVPDWELGWNEATGREYCVERLKKAHGHFKRIENLYEKHKMVTTDVEEAIRDIELYTSPTTHLQQAIESMSQEPSPSHSHSNNSENTGLSHQGGVSFEDELRGLHAYHHDIDPFAWSSHKIFWFYHGTE
ncbi:hypothetical protein F5B22DRAFT_646933 [Xylaria bambusicola]|uniref:uncharacterized protein n=1 Tax=Xylaria bambusicola TaxID=326684 RepID=UPI002007BC7F|nr:uncharacterized protein F5B22DRAFT_646933 [Xylaria bambusicola]KAI0515054.1 hypothetical protein F5B22DRAFT_646933 [Xylaria bambusicola]